MRWKEYVNEDEVRKAVSILQEPDEIFEIRVIGTQRKVINSGYFQDADTLLQAFDTIDLRGRNVYVTLGKVKRECFSRSQRERFEQTNVTTSDSDISGYRWLFIDLDPVRPTGISSSEKELKKSYEVARKVYLYLQSLGFEEPVKALSGNGCHLFYRIAIMNNEEGRTLVEKCLKVLALLFDSDRVKVDTTNYNPSRICKLHGTLAQKGSSTQERPHRMSRIFSAPDEIKITGKIFLEKLVAELPEEPKRETRRYQAPEAFDLITFMQRNGMTYKEDSNDRAKIFKLDHCPFDSSHADGDAKIFLYHNGAIAFKCHHNSCRQYKWQDVRKKFEPDAYDRDWDDSKYDEGWKKHNRDKTEKEVPYTETEEDIFRTARMIEEDPEPDHEYIRSGIEVIDQTLRGLQKTNVSVLTGVRGSGKSTILAQIILTAINDGHNVVCYSGELNNKKYLNWLIRQAAGKNHVEAKASGFHVDSEARQKIIDWFGDHFWLYNNRAGNNFQKIEQRLRAQLKANKADLCIIDNLMALDLTSFDQNKYDSQTKFVWALKNLAELTNTHIIFVAHPRKTAGFLRLGDISGSGNIANIVDNAFLIHRNNKDFQKGFQEWFGERELKKYEKSTNVVEIAKDREFGTQDLFFSLYYEESTKRLRNTPEEYITYGWDQDGWSSVLPDDIPF